MMIGEETTFQVERLSGDTCGIAWVPQGEPYKDLYKAQVAAQRGRREQNGTWRVVRTVIRVSEVCRYGL